MLSWLALGNIILRSLLLTCLKFLFCFAFVLPGAASAGLFDSVGGSKDQPLPVDEAYQMRIEAVSPGRFDLVWQVPPDYYLYRDKVSVTPGEGVDLVDRRNAESVTKDDPLFGQVEVYYDEARISLLLGGVNGVTEGTLDVSYQGCWEGGICYPPVNEKVDVADLVQASGLRWVDGDPSAGGDSSASANSNNPAVPVSEQAHFASLLGGASLAVTLGAFFVAGLALSLTPCVFPMIPILSGIIVGHGHRLSTGRAIFLSFIYVLAMALTYTVAGIIVGLFGANIQVALQNPWVISLFAGLFVALSLSMFGFYELQMPKALQSRVSEVSSHQKGGSITGVAVMGFLSALIVGPCMAAPLAGALIYIGQSGDPVLGGAALFVLSIGMGLPLLLVGASAGRLLPRAGVWMEGVKAAFGVVLLLMAVWMLDRILPVQITMALVGVILIISAVYLNVFERLGEHSNGWHRLWKGAGIILAVYGIALIVGVLSGSRNLLFPLQGLVAQQGTGQVVAEGQMRSQLDFKTVTSLSQLEPMLAQAAAVDRPVMLDFYADWCVSCVELEYVTFADPAVQARLAEFELIKVDVTANDADSKALNQRYQVFGPPVLVFHDVDGQERPAMAMVGVIEPEVFLKTIATL
ncbi:thiol:disulfide interchange protein DsbD [Marinobacterium mangrovicola]|uniref:Thiol:disulfide interchange protein DsbD n=1 Tax=Marinobacterium mangrovicola TaxID=1476959 RepID=A0A4R1GNS4_9GAMM|nr:thiol:disulfide interchange protein DsbD [Marinobacterium mangrovicola]